MTDVVDCWNGLWTGTDVRIGMYESNKPGIWSCCPIGDQNFNSLTLKISLSSNLKSKSLFPSTKRLVYIIQSLLRLQVRYLPVKLSIYLSVCLSVYGSIALSCALAAFLILYTVGSTPWMDDQTVARPLPTHRRTLTQNKGI
jgi:hypothetical protein